MYGIFTFIWRKCMVNVGKVSVCSWQFLSFDFFAFSTACIWAALLLSSWQMASHVDQCEINIKTMTRIRKHFGKSSRTIMGEIQQLTLFALAQKVPIYKWVRNSQWFFGSSSSQRGLPLYPKRVSPRVEGNRMDQDLFFLPRPPPQGMLCAGWRPSQENRWQSARAAWNTSPGSLSRLKNYELPIPPHFRRIHGAVVFTYMNSSCLW